MLELLINEDKEAAEALFHEIVVEKSRSIYESLLEDEADIEEDSDEEVDEASDEEVDEAADEDDDDEEMDEGFDLDQFEVEADDDMGGDPTDDMMSDLGMDDEEGEEGEEEGEEDDMEDRVEDLEDALEDLKAEFEKMMAGDDDMGDMDDDEEAEEESYAFESDDEEVEEASDEEVEEKTKEPKSAGEQMREYVEKVSATMGDNGANTKSAVAKPNNMGGTSANIAKGAVENGGKATPAKDMNTKNVNVPGAKAATKMAAQPGHGAEKKGKPETADNKKSMLGK